jgi:hypothetical protein
MKRDPILVWLALLLAVPAAAALPERAPDAVLTGVLTRADHETYQAVPFNLPAGTARLVLAFGQDGAGDRTVVDLGLADPDGFRGASGSNKPVITLAGADATPSYLPGRLVPGRWQLRLGVPNIRAAVTTRWQARLWFLKDEEAGALTADVAGRGPGWYRGDLHLHSAHSDGGCAAQSGAKVPCPLMLTLQTAAARGLDFVALSDHNSVSQLNEMRAMQPYFDRLLLIPAQEVTTFRGHFNVFGITEPVDYVAAGSGGFGAVADRVHALGGLVSINHPALPSGEVCMGCGWTLATSADLARVDAVEVVNGGAAALQGGAEGPLSGVQFWLAGLTAQGLTAQGLTAVGGSDNHDGTAAAGPGSVGRPETIVYATDLSQAAILAGIKAGRVFIDMTGGGGTLLDLVIEGGNQRAMMGSTLQAAGDSTLLAMADVRAPAGAVAELLADDAVFARGASGGGVRAAVPAGARIVRAVVRGADGKLLLIGNTVRIMR